jgi:hypothetical protein
MANDLCLPQGVSLHCQDAAYFTTYIQIVQSEEDANVVVGWEECVEQGLVHRQSIRLSAFAKESIPAFSVLRMRERPWIDKTAVPTHPKDPGGVNFIQNSAATKTQRMQCGRLMLVIDRGYSDDAERAYAMERKYRSHTANAKTFIDLDTKDIDMVLGWADELMPTSTAGDTVYADTTWLTLCNAFEDLYTNNSELQPVFENFKLKCFVSVII